MPNIIAFCGAQGSGKSEACDALVSLGYRHIAFADCLRDVCSAAFGLTDEEMIDPSLKTEPLKRWPFQSPRFIMQRVGTECFRQFWPEVWVEAVKRRLLVLTQPVCISDLRFPNELELIRNNNGYVVRINRPALQIGEDVHDSEAHWPTFRVDLELVNDADSADIWRDRIKLLESQWR